MMLNTLRCWIFAKKTFLIVLLAQLAPSQCRILRLSCTGFANFSIKKQGYLLEGHVIREVPQVSLDECYRRCFFEPRCKSINIEASGYGLCQLNDASKYDVMDAVDLTYNARWTYRSTNFSDLLLGRKCQTLNPCTKDQLCMDTCECPGYECIDCSGNKRGLHCNRCASNPCKNGGSCIELAMNICRCAAGFSGMFCEIDETLCETNPCGHHGTCQKVDGVMFCVCQPGYEGKNCERGNCTFETGICSWKKKAYNGFHWKRKKSSTQSKGAYAFIEASFPRKPGDRAEYFQIFSFLYNHCLRFSYHMYGKDVGQLNIYIDMKLIWSLHGNQNDSWYNASVAISNTVVDSMIRIEGIRGIGYRGDIAIDELSITNGSCPIVPLHAMPHAGMDPCSSNPCKYPSQCKSLNGIDFQCICKENTTGFRCETDLQMCQHCQRSALCLDDVNGHSCRITDSEFDFDTDCRPINLPKEDETSNCSIQCMPSMLNSFYGQIIDTNDNCICTNSTNRLFLFLMNCTGSYEDIAVQSDCSPGKDLTMTDCKKLCKSLYYKTSTTCNSDCCCSVSYDEVAEYNSCIIIK